MTTAITEPAPSGWAAGGAPILQLDDIRKLYNSGPVSVEAVRGVDLTVRAGRVRGDHRAVRLRQVHADAHPGLAWTRHRGHVPTGRDRRPPKMNETALATVRNERIASCSNSSPAAHACPRGAMWNCPLMYSGIARPSARPAH